MFSILSKSTICIQGWTVSTAKHRCLPLFSSISILDSDNEAVYDELKSLSQQLLKHDDLYYNMARPTISDEEYDVLASREAELCREFPLIAERLKGEGVSTRFGGRVGVTPLLQERLKRTHLVPMLSLENMHTTDDLEKWILRMHKRLPDTTELQIITEPKLDGLSLSIRYNQLGQIQWAATRGDGKQGQDVTLAVSDMGSIPTQIQIGSEVEVRGEIVLPRSAFRQMQEVDDSFSNARNAASGILLRKASNDSLRQALHFCAYDLVGLEIDDTTNVRQYLKAMGFQVPEPHILTMLTLNENGTYGLDPMLEYHKALESHKQCRPTALKFDDYDMDGAVHKVASLSERSTLGTSNRAPRWAMAYKFESQTSLTKLLAVEVQIGRTGALTPVARLDPVDIQGVIVQRATLHNFVHLQQMMGATQVPVGTPVLVRRAGDVIPQVVQRVHVDTATKFEMISLEAPTHCPACSSPVIWSEESIGNATSPILRCGGPSLNCRPRAIGSLGHAFSRDAFDIRGLSEARIEQLMDEGLLKIPSDLFRLASSDESDGLLANIAELPGWGPKSVRNLVEVVKKVVDDGVSLGRFIYSLGIRYTGQHTSNHIASIYGNVELFLDDLEKASDLDEAESFAILQEQTDETKGIGPVLVSSLQSFASDKLLVQAARALATVVKVKNETSRLETSEALNEGKAWSGFSVVFTGSLPGMSRLEAQTIAREMLGVKSTPDTVSKSTNLVVAGAKGGKKLAKAEELGVEIVDANVFLELIQTQREGRKEL